MVFHYRALLAGATALAACLTAGSASAQPGGQQSLIMRTAIMLAARSASPETIGYRYDALGRLVRVDRVGAAKGGIDTAYHYDQADNRAVRWTGSGAAPAAPPLRPPFFSIGNATVREGDVLGFTVTKSGSANANYSVNWATAPGTALAGSDFQTANGTLVFGPGEYAKTVTIATVNDTAHEGVEAMFVDLSGASSGAVVSGSRPDGNYPLNLASIESVSASAATATVENLTSIRFIPGGATGTVQVRYVIVDSTGVSAKATLGVTLTGTGPCQ